MLHSDWAPANYIIIKNRNVFVLKPWFKNAFSDERRKKSFILNSLTTCICSHLCFLKVWQELSSTNFKSMTFSCTDLTVRYISSMKSNSQALRCSVQVICRAPCYTLLCNISSIQLDTHHVRSPSAGAPTLLQNCLHDVY